MLAQAGALLAQAWVPNRRVRQISPEGAEHAVVPPFQGWRTALNRNPGLRKKRSGLGYYVSALQA